MMEPHLDTNPAAWSLAATLEERAVLPRASQPMSSSDLARARRRLQRWRQLQPFQRPTLFEERLALADLDENRLLELLGEPAEALSQRWSPQPPWVVILEEALRSFEDADPADRALPSWIADDDGTASEPYWRLAAPLVLRARRALRRRLQELAQELADGPRQLPFDPATVESLLCADLPRQLHWTLCRTVALEMYIAGLEDKLEGDTPEARHGHFFAALEEPRELRRFYQTYPALARLLTRRLENWRAAGSEMLERLVADWPRLRRTFSPHRDPGPLVEVRSGLGDRHLGGRTVCSLRFASGLRLIYKPQPMAVAVHFTELLRWLNARGLETPMRCLDILDRGTYGWVEYVEARACRSRAEVRRFYRRQGALLALLHATGGSDVHSENVITEGEQPVLIDFETVIQPHWLATYEEDAWIDRSKQMLRHTVLRVGLLPVPQAHDGPDRSGLGSVDGQRVPCPQLVGQGTDQLRLERRDVPVPEHDHRPVLDGRAAEVVDHRRDLDEGFAHTYRLLLQHRDALLAPGGPLQCFAADTVRLVVRPTRLYGTLLYESYHPFYLADALDRHRHFDLLWLDADTMPRLKELIPLESRALAEGDIPYFSTRLDGRSLQSGRQRLEGFLPVDGFQQLRDRVLGLGEADLERQRVLISNALIAHRSNRGTPPQRAAGYRVGEVSSGDLPAGDLALEDLALGDLALGDLALEDLTALAPQLIDAAVGIGDRLQTLALGAPSSIDRTGVTWMQPTVDATGKCIFTPMTAQLYGGLSGVVLFLAHLAELSGGERFEALARQATGSLELQLDQTIHGLETVGGFQGWGGLLYALQRLSRLWQAPHWLQRAVDLLPTLEPKIDGDPHLDVIAGVGGLIPPLLALYRQARSDLALELAVRCGQRLAATAHPQGNGVGWPSHHNGRPLGGFSHGAAGIAWALLELATALREAADGALETTAGTPTNAALADHFTDLASEALRYEATLWHPDSGTWRDLRGREGGHAASRGEGPPHRMTWCNGAPGIGLGRLAMLRHLDRPAWRRDARRAVEAVLQGPWGISHSLCHGDLGNLELLLQGRQVLGGQAPDGVPWDHHLAHRLRRILQQVEQTGWIDGTLPGMETPGLLSGLAGIGYGLLRLAAPRRVPSVLLLDDGEASHA